MGAASLIPSAAIPSKKSSGSKRKRRRGSRDERQLASAALASRRGTPLSISLFPPGYTSPVSLDLGVACLFRAGAMNQATS
jgi:hypothetical protein